jgi:signal transduction histidine kinase
MQLMGQVIEEGRDAVRGLRSTSGNADDLETAFSQAGQEFANEKVKDCRVIVEGTPKQLHPIIRDEAYRIGREALANAFRHSQANKIEIELEYSSKQLRILVRDDGTGIDPDVLQSGRDGHWGLAGMRERAESIGARLKVWSRANAGTEVELTIPSQVAFVSKQTEKKAS